MAGTRKIKIKENWEIEILNDLIFNENDEIILQVKFPNDNFIKLFIIEILEENGRENEQNVDIFKLWFSLYPEINVFNNIYKEQLLTLYNEYNTFLSSNDYPYLEIRLGRIFYDNLLKIKNLLIEDTFGETASLFSYRKITDTIKNDIYNICEEGKLIDKIENTQFKLKIKNINLTNEFINICYELKELEKFH